jgi:ZIP family zinc transporter
LQNVLLISLLAGLATGLGALPVILLKNIPRKLYDSGVGFAAGVMISVSCFGLIEHGFEIRKPGFCIAGIVIGALFVFLLEVLLPHPHLTAGPLTKELRRGVILATAITIHNFPDGFAVGAGYSSGIAALGPVIALAIAIHNIPEGLAIALPFRKAGVSRSRCLLYASGSGMAEPFGAVLAFLFLKSFPDFLSLGLGFAAGAMIYVASHELIPECHGHGNEIVASLGLIAGFILMLLIEVIFKV